MASRAFRLGDRERKVPDSLADRQSLGRWVDQGVGGHLGYQFLVGQMEPRMAGLVEGVLCDPDAKASARVKRRPVG